MWDTLTTGYLGAPQFITFREVQTEVIAGGPSAGRIKEVDTGRLIRVADTVEVAGFLDYLLELLRR
jgi:inosine-uridine nucleoside N-ribohydrolase